MKLTWFWEKRDFSLVEKTQEQIVDILGTDKVEKAEKEAKKNPGIQIKFYVGKGNTERTYFVKCY
jgi:hypothetical protein